MLEKMARPSNYVGPNVEFLLRNINESNEAALQEIFKQCMQNGKARIGMLLTEGGIGTLVDEWNKVIKTNSTQIELIESSYLIDEIFAVKDQSELECVKVASKYSCFIMEHLNKKFENIIDEDKKVSHSQIANDLKALTEKPQFQNKFKDNNSSLQIDLQNLEISSNPIIQSGGNYSLSPLSPNDSNTLSSDVIVCKVNTRYHDYNANIVRTFMIDADKSQQNYYKIIHEAFNILCQNLREGNKISSAYDKTFEFITSKDESLKTNLPDSFGNGIGLENLNSSLIITRSNEKKITSGMCFNVILSLVDLQTEKGFRYTLQIADTIGIKSNNNENYTNSISKLLEDIYYNMDEEEPQNQPLKTTKETVPHEELKGKRRTRQTTVTSNEDKLAELKKRKEHQLDLLKRKNEEFAQKMLRRGSDLNEDIQVSKKMLSSIKSYNSKANFPSDMKPGKIYIDTKADTVILPIFKQMVPFHISLIKNVTKSEENSFSTLRINFITPITGLSNFSIEETQGNNPVYIRDLSYKSKDQKYILDLLNKIKELIKNFKIKDQEHREKSDLVTQENLILMKGRKIALNDVTIRPNLTGKKTTGVLEAHTNGFRFTSNKGEKIDIIYKNIKHAFFQPCENELICLVHFHLKNPILLGKKKTNDIQFYKEAGTQADDLDMRRRGNDYEEYESELRERQMREKINEEFSRFTKNVEELKTIDFDVPYRDFAFNGVPHKSSVTLIPTAFCLVSLIELPFFVITLDEVEMVYFERVSHSLKNFDMAFIFKDLAKPVQRITIIPMENLEMIKSWLDECDIYYAEGLYNINWPKIIQKIRKDPQGFLDEGGWGFLQDEVRKVS